MYLDTLTSMSQKVTGLNMPQQNPPRPLCQDWSPPRPVPGEQRQAFGTAQRRSHAAKLEALQRKALEVSQGLQGLELRETHLGTPATFPGGAHMAHPNIYTSTFHTSSILIHPHHHPQPYPHPSSVIRHPSSICMQSCFHLSSIIMLASKSRTPRGIQVQGLNTTRQMRHQIFQMLVTEMLQSCKGQLHLTARGLISCKTIITWDHWSSLDVQPCLATI